MNQKTNEPGNLSQGRGNETVTAWSVRTGDRVVTRTWPEGRLIVNTEPGLPQPTQIRVTYEGNGEFEDREVFGASDAVIVRRKLPEYQDEEVVGLDSNGCVIQWDGDKGEPAATASVVTLEHDHDADPIAFVQAVKDAERTGQAAVMFRLLLDGQADATVTRNVVSALGTNGQQLVDAYLAARTELTQALRNNVQRSRDLVKAKLRVMLPECLTQIASGSEVFPRVVDVNSATLRDDGSIWGFLRVSTRENCFDSWEFTWKDGEVRILNESDVY